MDILLSFDDNYAMQASACMNSVMDNNRNEKIRFHIFHKNVEANTVSAIVRWIGRSGADIFFYKIEENLYLAFNKLVKPKDSITVEAFFRLLAARLLPACISRVLYLDCDTINLAPLESLWNLDISQYALAAVRGGAPLSRRLSLGLSKDDPYFNSGVLLINLEYWRTYQVTEALLEYAANADYLDRWDQDLLNAVCRGKWLVLPLKYNVPNKVLQDDPTFTTDSKPFSIQFSTDEREEAVNSPVILHYTGSRGYKPWIPGKELVNRDKYLKYSSMPQKILSVGSLPRVSVVIPVYKAEKFIRKCVDSVLAQSLTDIEVILVDDGSPDRCPEICDEYAQKDSRVVVIHQKNGGQGKAMNVGISHATGDYIGIVESDDWIRPDMYEILYNKIMRFDAEVAMSTFLFCEGESRKKFTPMCQHMSETNTFSISDFPELLVLHPSIWAKLYKRDLIKNIKFPEKTRYHCDVTFMFDVYLMAQKIIGCSDALYCYCKDNENASTHDSKNGAELMDNMVPMADIKKMLAERGRLEEFASLLYPYIVMNSFRFYHNIDAQYRSAYYQKIKDVLEGVDEKKFRYDLLGQNQRPYAKNLLKGRYWRTLPELNIKKLGIPVYSQELKRTSRRHSFFGVFEVEKDYAKQRNTVKLLNGLVKIELSGNTRKISLLGRSLVEYQRFGPVLLKIANRPLVKRFKENNVHMLSMFGFTFVPNAARQQAAAAMLAFATLRQTERTALLAQSVHQKTFAGCEGAFAGKNVYIVGTGQSLSKFRPVSDPNAIYIGLNRAFQSAIKLDFLFMQDYLRDNDFVQSPSLMREAAAYIGNNCKKFYGILPHRLYDSSEFMFIPAEYAAMAQAKRYYLEESFKHRFARNIEIEPLGDFSSVAFSAMQFALYGRPDRIFLVGCDTTAGSAFDAAVEPKVDNSRRGHWKQFRSHIAKAYPGVQIFSVNPVGLIGLFTDIYTD